MAPIFDERERTAETIYAHKERIRFLARRKGLESLCVWAAESMGLTTEDGAAYKRRLIDAFVSGTPEDRLVATIQTELERAGKPALSTHVGIVFAQAVAAATLSLRGQPPLAVQSDPHQDWSRMHPKQTHSWGWGL